MITTLNLPLYLMETFNCWSSLLHGYVTFMFLTTISRGFCSGCAVPSPPWCFRRNAGETVYICEWSTNSNESNVLFDLYFNETKFANIKNNWCTCTDEELIKYRPVHIWVEARVGDSSCMSPKRPVVLSDIIKYEVPQNISLSWFKSNLSLRWLAAEESPALAEVWFRRNDDPSESWEMRLTNTTVKASSGHPSKYQVTIVNLLKYSAYQVRIRQKSTVAKEPLWSDWSEVVIVPAELEHKPEVTMTKIHTRGTRKVVLTWKPMPNATAASGVTYSLDDTQSSHLCPCGKKGHHTNTNEYTIYLSNSAANISVIAKNAAGHSPPAVIQVQTEHATDLKACDTTLMNEKIKRGTCIELYELQYDDLTPTKVITLPGSMKKMEKKRVRENIREHIRYLYFEHRCKGGKPQTVKMCLYYQKEGVPRSKPQDLKVFNETHNSAHLTWKPIPLADHRGFFAHYSLCIGKVSSEYEPMECYNVTASNYHLENLTPGTTYNISVAGVTQAGEGPAATVTVKTFPEKPLNVWLSFSFLFVFFLLSSMCTIVLKRVKSKMFPPVPTPVIPDFTSCQTESQEMLEKKEVVHELTLQQLHAEGKSFSEEADEATVLRGEWDEGADEDADNERRYSAASSDECVSPGSTDQALTNSGKGETMDLEQVDTELALLIYRNGLVFDVKTDLY